MQEKIFLIWNGWGILFTLITIIWIILHIYFTTKFGSGTPARKYITIIPLIAIPATFILSNWILGILIIPISLIIGPLVAKLFIHQN